MARRQHLTPKQFIASSRARRASRPSALKARIKAELTWTAARARPLFRRRFQVSDEDVAKRAARPQRATTPALSATTTRSVRSLFVVPRGSPPALSRRARRRPRTCAAASPRCEEGLPLARALRDVAVREPINALLRRSAAGDARHPEQARDRPADHAGRHGAGRGDVRAVRQEADQRANRRHKHEVRDEMFSKRFEAESKKYLEELRKSSHDRIQDEMSGADVATAGADARRACRHRARSSRSRSGAARRTRSAAVLSASADPEFLRDARAAARPRRADRRSSTPAKAAAAFARALPVVAARLAGRPPSPASRRHQRAGRDRLDPPRRRRRARRRAPPPWSPIRSPRTCSTTSALPSPATPNISPSCRRAATGKPARPVMMLWSPELAVVPVTIHLPLRRCRSSSPRDLIVETGRIVARDLPTASASRGRGSRSPASIRMPARTARSARRTAPIVAPGGRAAARPTASTRAGRCRPTPCSTQPRARPTTPRLHVSRPGADPDQDAGLRPRASTSRSACPSCAPRPTTAPPSTSPAPAAPIRRA